MRSQSWHDEHGGQVMQNMKDKRRTYTSLRDVGAEPTQAMLRG